MKQVTDYNSLCKETERTRTTLMQSVNSLLKDGYIKEQKVNPTYEKSKLVFKLTNKGRYYVWNFMGLDAEDVLKDSEYPVVNDYILLAKKLPNYPRKYMFHSLAVEFLQTHGWIDDDKKKIVKDSFRKAILESIQDPDYDISELFNVKILEEWIRQMYSKEEIKEFKGKLSKIRDNLSKTIERFPT